MIYACSEARWLVDRSAVVGYVLSILHASKGFGRGGLSAVVAASEEVSEEASEEALEVLFHCCIGLICR